MKAALIQYALVWEAPEENILKLNDIMNEQLSDEELIIFPELTLTGFTMKSKKFAEEWDGIGTKYFINLAQKYKKHIFAGIIEKDDDKIFNSLYHFDTNGIIAARYRKIHPFAYSKEDEHYNAGNEQVITKIEKAKIGLTICYDLRFPELYRLYGKKQTEIIINIANWPIQRIEHWKVLLRSHAIANQCFVIGVNRVGKDPDYTYPGWSAVFDPMGNKIVLVEEEERLISVEFDLNKIIETREKLPFLKDMRLI
ncbi:nitrilase-related carbon-nitrogen hydrolase [Bacteroidota bacterium]